MDTTTIQLPKVFWDDHVSRDLTNTEAEEFQPELGTAVVLSETKKHYMISLDDAAWAELWSDADFYLYTGVDGFGWEAAGLISSARATLRRMKATGLNKDRA